MDINGQHDHQTSDLGVLMGTGLSQKVIMRVGSEFQLKNPNGLIWSFFLGGLGKKK